MGTHDIHADHHHEDVGPHSSFSGYMTGFAMVGQDLDVGRVSGLAHRRTLTR